ncbi:MAG: DUF2332 domain-containing protein [Acidimicrobiia bacterium]|nr:DUF2332 domain-containing protein [Acidimicrobiia bacterium]
MTADPPVTPDYLSGWRLHAETSPLYHHLVEVIAGDADLMRVINRIGHHPPPNLLFGAVHYLLLGGAQDRLGEFYRSLVPEPRPPREAGGPFRDFVLTNEDEIVEIGNTRFTQTNECRRCVALLPGVMSVGLDRFHLIEIGASAGLNLALDRYHYKWGDLSWGPTEGVNLTTESRGRLPELREIAVLSRTGLDLHPVNPTGAGDRKWLEALIWPEHEDRRLRLKAALEVAGQLDIELVAGDATDTLEPAMMALPAGEPVVVMDSFSLNQFPEGDRRQIDDIVDAQRASRQVARVSLEPLASDASAALRTETGDGWRNMGRMQHHGEWVELYARP